MSKGLAILCIIFCLAPPSWSRAAGSGTQRQKPSPNENGQKSTTPQTCLCNLQIQEEGTKKADDSEHKAYRWRELIAPANVPTWGLVIVGFGAAVVALVTLDAIKTQAVLMKSQADTAEKTLDSIKTQAVVMKSQAEIAEKTLDAIKTQAVLMKSQADIAEKTLVLQFRPRIVVRGAIVTANALDFVLVNVGGTPAHITRNAAMVTIHVPTESELKDLSALDGGSLQSGEARICRLMMQESVASSIAAANAAVVPDSLVAFTKVSPVYFVGVINYKDDLGIPRATYFKRQYSATSRMFERGNPDDEFND